MWFLLALFFALWSSIGVAIIKKILKSTDILVYLGFGNLISSISLGSVLFFRGFPKADSTFWVSIGVAVCLGIIVNFVYATAIKIAPISLTAPMAVSTPLVATFFGFLLLSETMTILKLLGILLVVFGVYLLNIYELKSGFLTPLKSLFQNRGVQLMLLAQGLVGITPIFEKTAIFHTIPNEPLAVVFTETALLTIILFPLMFFKTKNSFAQFKQNFWWFVLPAPISVFGSWAAFTAYSLANVGYVTAIFKLSALFTIVWGSLFFKEERIKEKFLGASVMIMGTILLVAT